jgi:hypothetical protein
MGADFDEDGEFLTPKELAARLRKHVSYVYAMKRLGFRMVAHVATLRSAIAWLKKNPTPRANTHGRGR